MIKYKITTQMENGKIVILNSEFENDKKLKEYMEEYVEPFAFVISTEKVEEPNE